MNKNEFTTKGARVIFNGKPGIVMKALILAGGRGKRLDDLSSENNKCMIKVNGRHVIEYNLDNAGAVDKGSGLVGIPITAHTFIDNDITTIAGTTNYNGTYTIVSQTANEIVITATYVVETFTGAETASWSRGWITITYEP